MCIFLDKRRVKLQGSGAGAGGTAFADDAASEMVLGCAAGRRELRSVCKMILLGSAAGHVPSLRASQQLVSTHRWLCSAEHPGLDLPTLHPDDGGTLNGRCKACGQRGAPALLVCGSGVPHSRRSTWESRSGRLALYVRLPGVAPTGTAHRPAPIIKVCGGSVAVSFFATIMCRSVSSTLPWIDQGRGGGGAQVGGGPGVGLRGESAARPKRETRLDSRWRGCVSLAGAVGVVADDGPSGRRRNGNDRGGRRSAAVMVWAAGVWRS